MEAIVSLLILGILLTTVVTIIRFSTSLTSTSITAANEAQDRFNSLILESFDEYSSSYEAIVTFASDSIDIEVSQDIIIYGEDGIVAFAPRS